MLMGSASVSQAGLGEPVKRVERLTYFSNSSEICGARTESMIYTSPMEKL